MKYFLFDHKCRKKGIYPRTFKGIISKKNGLLQAHFFNPYTNQYENPQTVIFQMKNLVSNAFIRHV